MYLPRWAMSGLAPISIRANLTLIELFMFPYFHPLHLTLYLYVVLLYTQCNMALSERGTKKEKYSYNQQIPL